MPLPNGFLPLIRLWYFTPEKVFMPRLWAVSYFVLFICSSYIVSLNKYIIAFFNWLPSIFPSNVAVRYTGSYSLSKVPTPLQGCTINFGQFIKLKVLYFFCQKFMKLILFYII